MLSFLELILFALLGRCDLFVLRTLPAPQHIFSFSSMGIFLAHLLWPATLPIIHESSKALGSVPGTLLVFSK